MKLDLSVTELIGIYAADIVSALFVAELSHYVMTHTEGPRPSTDEIDDGAACVRHLNRMLTMVSYGPSTVFHLAAALVNKLESGEGTLTPFASPPAESGVEPDEGAPEA